MQDRFETSVRRLGLEDPEALRSARKPEAVMAESAARLR
jgi:hypothetical protein